MAESIEEVDEGLLQEVWSGLGASEKTLPFKLFYDQAGVELYLRICELDEYYLTRTEKSILETQGAEIAAVLGPDLRIIEPGSGDGEKLRCLMPWLQRPREYLPIDIACEQLDAMAGEFRADFPAVEVRPICLDFSEDSSLPEPLPDSRQSLVFYPASSIGNFVTADASAFLARMGHLAGPGSELLVGVDLKKDPAVLIAAYDDSEGVSAAFNMNMLVHLNREAAANFDLDAFEHRAVYESDPSRIAMQLRSLRSQKVNVGGRDFYFEAGEVITTEHSHKPSIEDFAHTAENAGYRVERVWTDPQEWYSLQLLRPIAQAD